MQKYDVALSFAGEDRIYVERVAAELRAYGVKVFYDKYEETTLWGKNLYTYLSEVYKDKAYFTVMFISAAYKQKLWTNHERESAQARAFEESREYILPAKFDDSVEVPGVLSTIGYISLRKLLPEDFAKKIVAKLQDSTFSFDFEKNEAVASLAKRAEPPRDGWQYVAYLSYCASDSDLISEVKNFFTSRGITFYNESCFRPGDHFNNKIVKVIKNTKYFFYFIGEPSIAKTWQPRELESALSFRDIRLIERIIPVILPGGDPQAAPVELSHVQYSDLREKFNETGFIELVSCLG